MAPEGTRITIRRPDDWHAHFRTGAMLKLVAPHHARVFGRAIAMPNLVPPVTTAAMAREYEKEFSGLGRFKPLLTCYLTDTTHADDLAAGFAEEIFTAAKLYPAHATTNSAHGVADIKKIYPVLERMQKIGMPLLIHGEVTDPAIDIFDREKTFIDRILAPLLRDFPSLKIVMEHITTADAVAFIDAQNGRPENIRLGATITAHHLLLNRNDMLVGGIRPHYYCLPILKRAQHQAALRAAATSGKPWFFLGTDSAPHAQDKKETACGCAGVYTGHAALELYTEVFDEEGALDQLENFASINGAKFYGLPVNEDTVTLIKRPQTVPPNFTASDGTSLIPFRAGETVAWSIA